MTTPYISPPIMQLSRNGLGLIRRLKVIGKVWGESMGNGGSFLLIWWIGGENPEHWVLAT